MTMEIFDEDASTTTGTKRSSSRASGSSNDASRRVPGRSILNVSATTTGQPGCRTRHPQHLLEVFGPNSPEYRANSGSARRTSATPTTTKVRMPSFTSVSRSCQAAGWSVRERGFRVPPRPACRRSGRVPTEGSMPCPPGASNPFQRRRPLVPLDASSVW